MPMIGAPKKVVEAADAVFRTPVRRSVRQKTSLSPTTGLGPSSAAMATPPSTGNSSNAVMTTPCEHGSMPAAPPSNNKRKRKSLGNSTVKALAGCCLSSTKKRARVSLGGGPSTPGKAVPMDVDRERDVAKRFLELEVTEAYKAIRKKTGALGGNGAGGAIYGEITQNSFQRVVDYMKAHCELTERSLFLDVGSGLGKPNFHVAIDPGVEVSYGIELEDLRWQLSLHNLKSVMALDINKNKASRTIFTAGDITHAHTLNPFSHIYSFDVGFPPDVMESMAQTFNRSDARYLVSFHSPRKIIDMYEFNVENIGRVATSMAGSNEGHTCYFYRRCESSAMDTVSPPNKENSKRRRTTGPSAQDSIAAAAADSEELLHIDPLFRPGFDVLSRGKDGVLTWAMTMLGEQQNGGRTRRQRLALKSRQSVERPLESYYRIVGKSRSQPLKK
ncbi:hypothetical protein P43SY_006955 [Pythium insidiosum]|uniref:DOT1 domain-containing protein n=1 Tax=Pythium insidiosum TaxID=114742 RepID=A0AAD5LUG3_PYTIN|nr:hypothetical protein P43SY_006955 [Pythium insidiosum]